MHAARGSKDVWVYLKIRSVYVESSLGKYERTENAASKTVESRHSSVKDMGSCILDLSSNSETCAPVIS